MPTGVYERTQEYRDKVKRGVVASWQGRRRPAKYVVEDRGYVTSCWIWRRSLNGRGYPYLSITTTVDGKHIKKSYRAHRYLYEQAKGPIPKGLELDHLCRQRDCVNPDHLEPVTHRENCRRARWQVGVKEGLGRVFETPEAFLASLDD